MKSVHVEWFWQCSAKWFGDFVFCDVSIYYAQVWISYIELPRTNNSNIILNILLSFLV